MDESKLDRMARRVFAAYKSMPDRGKNVDSHYIEDKGHYLERLNRAQAYCECNSLDDENLDVVVNGFIKDGCSLDADAIKFILRNFWKLDSRC